MMGGEGGGRVRVEAFEKEKGKKKREVKNQLVAAPGVTWKAQMH